MIYGKRDKLQLIRKDDNDTLFRTAAAGAGKVVLSKFAWLVPIVQPNEVNIYKSIAGNNVKRTRVVIRRITPPFLITATLRICKCG